VTKRKLNYLETATAAKSAASQWRECYGS